jgi:N-carbamoylputrescine amidase
MSSIRIRALAAPFGRDLEEDLRRAEAHIATARADGVDLLVLPEAALGGYLTSISEPGPGEEMPVPPAALQPDGPEIARIAAAAGDLVVCVGLCEDGGDVRYNAAACLSGDGVLGWHRKVHQPLSEHLSYGGGDRFAAFETPVGRLGMMICYDKAFPESARALALDGAHVVACISAWPGSSTGAARDLADDRWKHRFDLFDRARALENQVVWAASNQSGEFGSMRFVGSAKIVDPGGAVLSETGVPEGAATADVDVEAALATARRSMFHLRDRRADTYGEAMLPV